VLPANPLWLTLISLLSVVLPTTLVFAALAQPTEKVLHDAGAGLGADTTKNCHLVIEASQGEYVQAAPGRSRLGVRHPVNQPLQAP
jgi:hypothetical protein